MFVETKNQLKKVKKAPLVFSILFAMFAFALFWSICECSAVIFTDDMIYANWTKHGFKYFFEQINWHYNNFNGRTLTHTFLSILLSAKEHLYSIFVPLSIALFSFVLHGTFRKEASFAEKMCVSGITMLGFIGLSQYYLTYSVIWMSSGANYILPLLFITLAYKVFLLARNNNKLNIISYICTFIAGATTEQYGMYIIGLIVMTMLFDIIDKKKEYLKKNIISLICAIAGLSTVFFAPGTFTRAEGNIVSIGQILEIFNKNNYTLSGYYGHSAIMFIIIACFGIIGIDKKHRLLIVGIPIAIINYILYSLELHSVAGILFFAYVILICVHFLMKKDMREYGKIMVCGYGTFLMMSITNIGGFRVCVPLLVSIIFVLSSIYVGFIKNNIRKILHTLIVISVMFLCFINGFQFYLAANYTATVYSNPLYTELSNAKETGVINLNYDLADAYNAINHVRHSTCFDSGMLLDIKYCQEYFGYSDDVIYNHTSEKMEVYNLSYNGKYYVIPAVKNNDKIYVPYTFLVMNEKSKIKSLSEELSWYMDDSWSGHIVDENNLCAIGSNERLVTIKNGEIIYENDSCDFITQYFKTSPSIFIEISQFSKWADLSYTFNEKTNTYCFTSK